MDNKSYLMFIRQNGIKLNFHTKAITTACYIYQQSNSLSINGNPWILAISCLYLASKVEEEGIKLRDILNVCNLTLYSLQIDQYSEIISPKQFFELVDSVSHCEYLIMRKLGFRTSYPDPYNYLSSFLKQISNWIPDRENSVITIYATALSFLEDSYMSQTNVKLIGDNPSLFALSVVYLTIKLLNIRSSLLDQEWWDIFVKGSLEQELTSRATSILKMYLEK